MTDDHDLIITPLNHTHDRTAFSCGIASLDNYLKKQAKQDVKRKISRVFVACTPQRPNRIIGYYTLSSLSIQFEQLPQQLSRKLPKQGIPAALIGRLAVSQQAQRKGVGRMLLTDAIKRTINISDEMAIYATVVDALDEEAAQFYRQYGFSPLNAQHHRLFLALKQWT